MDDDDKYPSQLADRFQVRMPPGLRDRIAKAAAANGRSMNAEIVQLLEDRYPPEQELRDLVAYIEEIVDHAVNNDWRDSRKYLVDGLREIRERIVSETFDPREMGRPSSSYANIGIPEGAEMRPNIFTDEIPEAEIGSRRNTGRKARKS